MGKFVEKIDLKIFFLGLLQIFWKNTVLQTLGYRSFWAVVKKVNYTTELRPGLDLDLGPGRDPGLETSLDPDLDLGLGPGQGFGLGPVLDPGEGSVLGPGLGSRVMKDHELLRHSPNLGLFFP